MMRRLSRALGRNSPEQKVQQVATQTKGASELDGVANGVAAKTREPEPWIVEERSIDTSRPMRVVVIGSGISGIISSIRLRQRIGKLDLQVYEKNADIGGTWLENRYPGCACGEYINFFLRALNTPFHGH